MTDRKQIPGKFVWFEHVSRDTRKAQAFYREMLGWKAKPSTKGEDDEVILAGDALIGGYRAPGEGEKARWIAYASVEDVDAAANAAASKGGKVVEPPHDVPEVGKMARIADPQGAELALVKKVESDPPDLDRAPHGTWLWNELHTTDPTNALAFYERVVGFSHKKQDMGPAGTYYVLEGNGVGRGGVTGYLDPGTKPHWLPYVAVDDADATIERARKAGGKIQFGPEDIPGIGRFGIVEDPTGAVLAVMKPAPMP